MSKFQRDPAYSKTALQKQWINVVWGSHDLICGCQNAIKHLFDLTKEECLSTKETATETGGTEALVDVITNEDIENVFNEENTVQDDDG